MRSHSRRCLLRWTGATWAITIAIFSLYLIWVDYYSPSVQETIELYLVVGLLGVALSVVAVSALARPRHLAVALVATPLTGFLLGYVWALITYGAGAEDGTVWRGGGGAIVGTATAVAAWVLLRTTHRTMSRDSCPTATMAS